MRHGKRMKSNAIRALSELPALYVHVPFCASKCSYCDFFSLPQQDDDIKSSIIDRTLLHLDVLLEEMEPSSIDTLYIGGGTPNSLNDKILRKLLAGLQKRTEGLGLNEWTVEVNPEFVRADQLMLLRDHGVDRISIGIQSFADKQLRFLGRAASAQNNRQSLDLIGEYWDGRWNLDLITGIPGQNRKNSLDDLHAAIEYRPDHLSVYNLTIEEGTALWKRFQNRDFNALSPEEEARNLKTLWTELAHNGYRHYEVSNFCLPGEQSAHNLHYWRMHPYAGVGPGAVSTLPDGRTGRPVRLEFEHNFDTFLQKTAPNSAEQLPFRKEKLSHRQFLLEYVMMGLRTIPGIELSSFKRIFGISIESLLASTLRENSRMGLMQIDAPEEETPQARYLSVSEEGMLLLDRILSTAYDEMYDTEPELNWPL